MVKNGAERTYSYKGLKASGDYCYRPKEGIFRNIFNSDLLVCTSSEVMEYYEPGEKVIVTSGTADDGVFETHYDNMGVESEVVHESRSFQDETMNATVEWSLELGQMSFFPFFIPYAIPQSAGVTMNYETMSTHVTTKTVTFPCLLKKVTRTVNGVKNVSENLVFDKFTGNPVVVNTYDEFDTHLKSSSDYTHDGAYTVMNIPASHVYSGMGQKSQNDRSLIGGSNYSMEIDNSDMSAPFITITPTNHADLCNLGKSFPLEICCE